MRRRPASPLFPYTTLFRSDWPRGGPRGLSPPPPSGRHPAGTRGSAPGRDAALKAAAAKGRSEEHTSELQSQFHLVCRLLLEKKKIKQQPDLTFLACESTPL